MKVSVWWKRIASLLWLFSRDQDHQSSSPHNFSQTILSNESLHINKRDFHIAIPYFLPLIFPRTFSYFKEKIHELNETLQSMEKQRNIIIEELSDTSKLLENVRYLYIFLFHQN